MEVRRTPEMWASSAGYCLVRSCWMTCISAAAWALVMPGERRPITSSWPQPRSLPEGFLPSMQSEVEMTAWASGALGKAKAAGSTPMTV